jgi:hypothetical protein
MFSTKFNSTETQIRGLSNFSRTFLSRLSQKKKVFKSENSPSINSLEVWFHFEFIAATNVRWYC